MHICRLPSRARPLHCGGRVFGAALLLACLFGWQRVNGKVPSVPATRFFKLVSASEYMAVGGKRLCGVALYVAATT